MKIWNQYSSEHSANLVMIGRFEVRTEASKTKALLEQLVSQVNRDIDAGEIILGHSSEHYSDQMLDLLVKLNLSIGPAELEQLIYNVNIEVADDELVITTDELDISAFIKVLIHQGARIELFSKHNYPTTGSKEDS